MNIFLWPKGNHSFSNNISFFSAVEQIEHFFESLYGNDIGAVFVPSGRAALHMLLTYLQVKRSDFVWIPEYSSHCVFNAVAYSGTPTTTELMKAKVSVPYHVWGFVHHIRKFVGETIIEDSVDSLCESNMTLFPNGGRFEIFSLPKIISSSWGGVILCKQKSDADSLRNLLSENSIKSVFNLVLRSSRLQYLWHGAEPLNRSIGGVALGTIMSGLDRWEQLIRERKKKLELLASYGIVRGWQDQGRYPTAVPIKLNKHNMELLRSFNIVHDGRMIPENRIYLSSYLQKAILPIHEEVSLETLEKIVKKIV